MDNKEVITDLLESYKRYSSSRELNNILSGQFQSDVEKICDSYISTQNKDTRTVERRDQYISFINEAAPIVEKNDIARALGILGGIAGSYGSAAALALTLGGGSGLAGFVVGGAVSA